MRTRRFRPSVLALAFGLLCTLIAQPASAAEGRSLDFDTPLATQSTLASMC